MLARVLRAYDAASDIPRFMAPAIIEQAAKSLTGELVFVATNRSRESWVRSMHHAQGKGGVMFRLAYNVPISTTPCAAYGCMLNSTIGMKDRLVGVPAEVWGSVWDHHQRLLERYAIPAISLEAPDRAKWSALC